MNVGFNLFFAPIYHIIHSIFRVFVRLSTLVLPKSSAFYKNAFIVLCLLLPTATFAQITSKERLSINAQLLFSGVEANELTATLLQQQNKELAAKRLLIRKLKTPSKNSNPPNRLNSKLLDIKKRIATEEKNTNSQTPATINNNTTLAKKIALLKSKQEGAHQPTYTNQERLLRALSSLNKHSQINLNIADLFDITPPPPQSTNIQLYPLGAPIKLSDRAIIDMRLSPDEKMVLSLTGEQLGQVNRLATGKIINPQLARSEAGLSRVDRQWLLAHNRSHLLVAATFITKAPALARIATQSNKSLSNTSARQLAAPLKLNNIDEKGNFSASPWIYALALYPQGNRLVTGDSGGFLRVWNIKTQQPLGQPIVAHQGWVFSIAIDASGLLMASAGNDGKIRFFSSETGAPMYEPILARGNIYSLIFSANGRQLFSSSNDGSIRLWNVRTGKLISELSGHKKAVFALAMSPNGKTLASAGADGSIRLWSTTDNKLIKTMMIGEENSIYGLAFNPGGNLLASAGLDSQVRIWSIASTNSLPYSFYTKGSALSSIAFSPDGNKLIAGSFDHKIWQWDFATGELTNDSPLSGHSGRVNNVAFHPDGLWFASASNDGSVRQWRTKAIDNLPSSKLSKKPSPNTVNLYKPFKQKAIAQNPKTFEWAVASFGLIRQYGKSRNIPSAPAIKTNGTISSMAYSDDGMILIGGNTLGNFWLWSSRSGRLLSSGQSDFAITSIALSINKKWLATGHENGSVQLFFSESIGKIKKWLVLPSFTDDVYHQGAVRALAFLPQNVLASAGDNQQIVLQRIDNGKILGTSVGGHFTSISSLLSSKNGKTLYSAGVDGTLQKWSLTR